MSKKFLWPAVFSGSVLYLMIILSLSGCGVRDLATGKIAPPEVALQGFTLYPPESQCWPLSATLRLTNPNPEPLRILGYDYEVWLEGTELVRGESTEAITLPAGVESIVEVPILLKLPAVPQTLKNFLLKEKVQYELAGGFRLASLLGGMKVPFRFRGAITQQEGLKYLRGYLDSKT
ncbi:MAG: LEA type 2 family protein [Deltaproteobacteria bacterium]|nr:LEA type 2 family protein [Deltaproteobacteria bacterium]